MKVSLIIPTFNRSDALALTLDRLADQDFQEKCEVIVVNNNCTDDTDEVFAAHSLRCPAKIVHRTTPGGVASSRNAGAREAAGEYLIFLDNDILVAPDFVRSHVAILDGNPGAWVVGAIELLPEQQATPLGRFRMALGAALPAADLDNYHGFTGANCSLPRRDFERLGGFDEGFIISSSEDQEFAMRARIELGVRIIYAPQIVGVHNDWAGWTFSDYCQRQNLYRRTDYYFWLKYGDRHPRQAMLLESFPVSLRSDSFDMVFRKVRKRIFYNRIIQSFIK
jgi:GT2 family glycosyltransferase